MELNNSHNDNTRSTMVDLIRNRYQDPGVVESLNDNEELLRRMGRHVESLLCTQNVDEALSVAKEMTFMVPTSSTGALYERLVSKYNELSDKMDNARASMATLYNSTQKIDFISMLPFDIVSKVVDYLWATVSNMHVTTPAFLYVSKHWRQKILECTPYLSYQLLSATQNDRETTALSHASHIRTMRIRFRVISFSRFLDMLLINLQRLWIDLPSGSTLCQRVDDPSFSGTCPLIRHRYNLDEVMELCPNLITLKWSGSPLYTRNEKQYDTLRILQLDVREDEYHDLLAKLPGLVVLSINIGLSIYSLCRVSRYCSSLKCIKYYTHPYDAIRWPYEYDQSLEPGIQELYFGDGYYGDLTENINENLIRAAKTLKYLEVQHSLYEEEPVMIPLPSDTMFPHLIHLSGAPESDDVLRLLLSIIPRAPSLEVIRLGHPFILWEDSAPINTMASLVHLTDTNVIMEENYQEIDVLKRFLTIHIQKGSYSQLRSLAIGIWTEECAQELLPLLLQLPLLEKLHIAVDYDTPLPTILDAIATKNAMKQLKLSVIICDTIDEPIFGRLQHAPSLTSLIIDVHHLSTMAALSLLDLTRLVHLQIPFEGLEDMTIDILRKQFPNMIPLESPSMF